MALAERKDVKEVIRAYERVCRLERDTRIARDKAHGDTSVWLAYKLKFDAIQCRRLALRERTLGFFGDHPEELPPDVALDIAILLPLDAELEALNELRDTIADGGVQ